MPRSALLILVFVLCAAPALAQRSAPSPERQAVEAERLFVDGMTRAYAGDHDEAITLYEEALTLAPDEPAILTALAEAHEVTKDPATALFYAARAVEVNPDEPSGYRLLAGLQLALGDTDGALASYEQLAESIPTDLQALTALARLQQQSGQFDAALLTYERVLGRVGESSAVRVRMLSIYQRLGQTAGAIEALVALVLLEPENAALQRQLAALYADTGRSDEAITTLEALLATHPEDAEARLILARLVRASGDEARADALLDDLGDENAAPEDLVGRAEVLYRRAADDPSAAQAARRLLEAAVEAGTTAPRAYLLLGDLRFRTNDWAEAADALSQALRDDPTNLPAWAQLIASRLQTGDAAAAVDAADEALLLFPGQYALVRLSALAHTEAGRHRDALRLFEEALDLLAEDGPEETAERSALLANVGIVQARIGNDAAADAAYAEAIELDGENALALNNYAYSLAQRGEQLDEALDLAQRAVALDPDSPSFLDTLGWVHFTRGDFDEAAERLTQAVEAGGRTAVILEHLGDAEAARGKAGAAREHWQAALDLDPENEALRNKLSDAP